MNEKKPIPQVKKTLQEGEGLRVAEITGYSLSMVYKVLNGKRENAKISKCAELIVSSRELTDNIIKQQLEAEFN
jgi:predicted transcriptional regulator